MVCVHVAAVRGQVVGSCECGNEPSGYIKCREFLDQLLTRQFRCVELVYFFVSAVMEVSCQLDASAALFPRGELPAPVGSEWAGREWNLDSSVAQFVLQSLH